MNMIIFAVIDGITLLYLIESAAFQLSLNYRVKPLLYERMEK